jgi:hypothetical protein
MVLGNKGLPAGKGWLYWPGGWFCTIPVMWYGNLAACGSCKKRPKFSVRGWPAIFHCQPGEDACRQRAYW